MSETVNQDTTMETSEKTFTQAEMDAIIGDRLKRERAKYSDYEDLKTKAAAFDAAEEASKSDLQKANERAESLQAELDAIKRSNQERELRERISQETGVPSALLRGNSEEDLRAQAEAIKGYAQTATKYPNVRDAGEVRVPVTTKADILAIKDERERLNAIKDHIELFQ